MYIDCGTAPGHLFILCHRMYNPARIQLNLISFYGLAAFRHAIRQFQFWVNCSWKAFFKNWNPIQVLKIPFQSEKI